MNKVLMGAIALAGMVAVSTAQADMDIHPFAKVNSGYSKISESDVDNAVIHGMSVGVTIDKKHDIEFEYAHSQHDFQYSGIDDVGKFIYLDGDIKIDTAMLNYRYLFNVEEKLRPYVLGGIGIKKIDEGVDISSFRLSDSDTVLAYQVGFGAKYALTENVYLDGSYRYQGSEDFTVSGDKYEINNNNFVFGIAYQW